MNLHKKYRKRIILGITPIILTGLFLLWQSEIAKERQVPIGPFQIADNLYYVGTTNVSSFLLTGPEGHVLIDGNYPETAPMIIESITKLGFNITDVKVLVNSHAHSDHAGGLAELKETSGAELWASTGDADVLESGGREDLSFGPLRFLHFIGLGSFPPVQVDHRFEDGDTLKVGPLELTAHVTAGHTPGCTSWSFPIKDEDRELLALNICSLTMMPFTSLTKPESYSGIREDFEQSFKTLKDLPVDVFLASHTGWFNLRHKMKEQTSTDKPVTPFIDPEGYRKFIEREENHFLEVLKDQSLK